MEKHRRAQGSVVILSPVRIHKTREAQRLELPHRSLVVSPVRRSVRSAFSPPAASKRGLALPKESPLSMLLAKARYRYVPNNYVQLEEREEEELVVTFPSQDPCSDSVRAEDSATPAAVVATAPPSSFSDSPSDTQMLITPTGSPQCVGSLAFSSPGDAPQLSSAFAMDIAKIAQSAQLAHMQVAARPASKVVCEVPSSDAVAARKAQVAKNKPSRIPTPLKVRRSPRIKARGSSSAASGHSKPKPMIARARAHKPARRIPTPLKKRASISSISSSSSSSSSRGNKSSLSLDADGFAVPMPRQPKAKAPARGLRKKPGRTPVRRNDHNGTPRPGQRKRRSRRLSGAKPL
jgi:hypothetical protein